MPQVVKSISDIQEIESVPLSRRELPGSTYEAISQGAADHPNKVALHFFMRGAEYKEVIFYTFEDLTALINQTANLFNGLGIEKTDVISVILPDLPQSFFAIFGGQAAGIVNPISPLLEAEQMAEIMNAAGSKMLVTLAPFIGTDIWQKVVSIADRVPTLEVILKVDLVNYLPTVQKWAVKWMLFREDKGPKVRVPVYDFAQTARRFTGEKLLSERDIQPGDTACYFPSSLKGSEQKLVKLTHFNQVLNAWALAETLSIPAGQNFLCGLPLYNASNLIISGLMPWMKGGSIVLSSPSGFREEGVLANFWQIIDFYQINIFCATRNLFQTLPDIPVGEANTSSLNFALHLVDAHDSMPVPYMEKPIQLPVLQAFGLAEASGIFSVVPLAGQRQEGSIGFPLPYQEMKAAELDDKSQITRFCDAGENGLIILRGPHLFAGYVDGNRDSPSWLDEGNGQELWFNSRLEARQDAKGFLWLAD